MAIRWLGDQLTVKIQKAENAAIDATMQAANLHAKENHLWQSRTGGQGAEGSIRIVSKAHRDNRGAVGRWGSNGIAYFRRLEHGFQGKDSLGRVYSGRGKGLGGTNVYPALLPARDAEYPNLAGRIKDALARGRA